MNIAHLLGAISPLGNDWPPSNWTQNAISTSTTPPLPSSTASSRFPKPTAGQSWNIQLNNVPPASASDDNAYSVWDIDMAAANSSLIDAFHAKGRDVICYFSAGSVETSRSDASDFPAEAVAKKSWRAGRTRNGWMFGTRGVRDVMRKRIHTAFGKVKAAMVSIRIILMATRMNPDFDLTMEDAVQFVRSLAQTAHDAGLTYGLKNGGDLVDRVVDVSDWDINEECVHYQECDAYRPFIDANKPVFHIEYPDTDPKLSIDDFKKKSCSDVDARGFSTLVKDRNLGDYTLVC